MSYIFLDENGGDNRYPQSLKSVIVEENALYKCQNPMCYLRATLRKPTHEDLPVFFRLTTIMIKIKFRHFSHRSSVVVLGRHFLFRS